MEQFIAIIKDMDRDQLEKFALDMVRQAAENKTRADEANRKLIDLTALAICDAMNEEDAPTN